MSYPEDHVERFATARNKINAAGKKHTDEVSLQLEGKVRMTLEAYEAVADLLPILTVPARHLQCGDHFNGMVVSRWQRLGDRYTWTLVVPFTTHVMKIVVREEDLDSVSFPITKRGDNYSPNARNAALGLPLEAPKPYVAPEPIARYAVGTKMSDVRHFDRGQHIVFKCPDHGTEYSSKDPYCSSWFHDPAVAECPVECSVRADDMVVSHEYLPTRNG